ncbi:MAG: MFS transporter [Actinomycetota bacterium]|nr:MFS transporter [Actinomycetota bacterium]
MFQGALRNRAFRLLFGASAVSSLGDRVVPVALAFAVLNLTGSTTDLGIVLGAQTVPLVALLLLGGVWSDRLPRQLVMLSSDAVRATAQGLTAFLLLTGDAKVWQLAVLQAAYGAADAFFTPASTGLVPQTVAADDLQQANALMSLSASASAILGPALAGVIVATIGAGWGFAIDAISFVVSAIFLSRLRTDHSARVEASNTLQDLRSSWQTFRSHSWLWAIAAFFALFLGLAYSPLQVLGPQICRLFLGGAGAWAAINVARGVGSLLGGTLGLRWKPRYPLRTAFMFFLIGAPALLASIAAHAPLVVIVAFGVLDGITVGVFNTLWFTAVQHRVPADQLSRVAAWDALAADTLQPVGQATSGPVGALLGLSSTLYGAAALTLVMILAMLGFPAVRHFSYQDDDQSSKHLRIA